MICKKNANIQKKPKGLYLYSTMGSIQWIRPYSDWNKFWKFVLQGRMQKMLGSSKLYSKYWNQNKSVHLLTPKSNKWVYLKKKKKSEPTVYWCHHLWLELPASQTQDNKGMNFPKLSQLLNARKSTTEDSDF